MSGGVKLPTPFVDAKDGTFRLCVNGQETILHAKSWGAIDRASQVDDILAHVAKFEAPVRERRRKKRAAK